MNIYFMVFIIFNLISLLAGAYMHGKKKEGSYNFWIVLTSVLLEVFLVLGIMNWSIK